MASVHQKRGIWLLLLLKNERYASLRVSSSVGSVERLVVPDLLLEIFFEELSSPLDILFQLFHFGVMFLLELLRLLLFVLHQQGSFLVLDLLELPLRSRRRRLELFELTSLLRLQSSQFGFVPE